MDAYREMKLLVCTHNLGSDIVVCGRAVWVRMSQETLGGYMFTRDETVVSTCYLGSDIAEDFGRRMYRRDKREEGLLVCGVRAILRPDVTLDFGHGVCILRVLWALDVAGEFKWVHLYVMGDHLG